MAAPLWEIRTACPSCHVLARFAAELVDQRQPCPSCGRPVLVEGARVAVEQDVFSADWDRIEEQPAPRGLAGMLFGGGLAAGVAAMGVSTVTHGLLSTWLLFSGLSMVVAWVLTRRLPPRAR